MLEGSNFEGWRERTGNTCAHDLSGSLAGRKKKMLFIFVSYYSQATGHANDVGFIVLSQRWGFGFGAAGSPGLVNESWFEGENR